MDDDEAVSFVVALLLLLLLLLVEDVYVGFLDLDVDETGFRVVFLPFELTPLVRDVFA